MKVARVEPALAIQRERRSRNQEEKAQALIEQRRQHFRNSLAKSLNKGNHIDRKI